MYYLEFRLGSSDFHQSSKFKDNLRDKNFAGEFVNKIFILLSVKINQTSKIPLDNLKYKLDMRQRYILDTGLSCTQFQICLRYENGDF